MDRNNHFVRKKENKNKTSNRTVPILINELYDELKASQKPSGLVVTCSPSAIYETVNRLCRKNNLPEVGVHGLRHTFASLAYHLNVLEKLQWRSAAGVTTKR